MLVLVSIIEYINGRLKLKTYGRAHCFLISTFVDADTVVPFSSTSKKVLWVTDDIKRLPLPIFEKSAFALNALPSPISFKASLSLVLKEVLNFGSDIEILSCFVVHNVKY